MKKSMLSLMLISLLALLSNTVMASSLTVAQNGTTIHYCVPFHFEQAVSCHRSQILYPSSYLTSMTGKVIRSLTFYGSTTNQPPVSYMVLKVKIGTTNYTSLYDGQWNNDPLNTVLYGHATFYGSQLTVNFNTGFLYTGGNLLVEIENVTSPSSIGTGWDDEGFYGVFDPEGNYYSNYKTSSGYPVTSAPTTDYFLPKTTFQYDDYADDEGSACWDFWSLTSQSREWLSLNGKGPNVWVIGSGASTSPYGKGLYITGKNTTGDNSYQTSSSDGIGNTSSAASKAFVYRYIWLDAGEEYVISYDWRCNGESTYDYMRIGLAEASASNASIGLVPGSAPNWSASSLPSGVVALDGGSKLNGHNSWQHKSVTFTAPGTSGHYRFILFWCNDNSGGGQSPAAIDRIRITKLQTGGYHTDFEDNQYSEWNYEYDDGYNDWNTSTNTCYTGNKSMHVGSDAGHLYSYVNDEPSDVYTYVPIRLKAGAYLVSFNWKCGGEASNDYMKLFLAPFYYDFGPNTTAIPAGAVSIGSTFYGQTSWKYSSFEVNVPQDTIYNLAVYWHNNANGSGSNPGAIDNLSITKIVGSLPVNCTFENFTWNSSERWNWSFANGAQTNHWMRGSETASSGSYSLYITNQQNGGSYTYNNSSTSVAFVQMPVDLDAGQYNVSFNWKNNGEDSYDFVRAVMACDSTCLRPGYENNWINDLIAPYSVSISGRLSGQSSWQTFNGTVTIPHGGVWRLVFVWRNDYSQGSTPPAAIDNVQITQATQYHVSVSVSSSCTGMGTVSGGGDYYEGETATISATANPGYHFVEWQDGNTSATRTFTVDHNYTFYAYFAANEPDRYYVQLSASPANGGTVSGDGEYADGSTATVSATPNTGYHFVNWSNGDTRSSFSFTVTEDVTLTAYFEENEANEYTVSVASNNTDWGSVTGGGTYAEGSTAIIEAIPNEGYHFDNWYGSPSPDPILYITVTEDISLTANFAPDDNGGIADVNGTAHATLIPNPSNGNTMLLLEGLTGDVTITLYDISGRAARQETVVCDGQCQHSLSIEQLAAGTYMVRITSAQATTTQKLIVR